MNKLCVAVLLCEVFCFSVRAGSPSLFSIQPHSIPRHIWPGIKARKAKVSNKRLEKVVARKEQHFLWIFRRLKQN